MTETEKSLVTSNLVKSESSEPLYRKWWVWVIAGVVILGLFGPKTTTEEVTSPTISTGTADLTAPEAVPAVENPWGDWWILNETNWMSLSNTLSEGDYSTPASIADVLETSIYYGDKITDLPDAYAQSLFDDWLNNMKSAKIAVESGNYDMTIEFAKNAGTAMSNLTDYIEIGVVG